VEPGSVFQLDPAAAHWLAETFDDESPEHALLDSLALSAEADAGRKGLRRVGDGPAARPLRDLLSEETVGEIVEDVAAAFPDLPIPQEPGREQLRAIDSLVRQGSRQRAPTNLNRPLRRVDSVRRHRGRS
jgi:hypothetical protein